MAASSIGVGAARTANCRRDADPARGQRRPSPQRHDAVGAAVDLSPDQGAAAARLRPHWHHHAGVPADRLGAAADHRPLHRQASAAVLVALRHGLDLLRDAGPGLRRRLCHGAGGGRPDRRRQLGVPSRGLARGPARVGRPLRLRPVAVPGRRQCRPGDRPAARGPGRDPQRPGACRLVRFRSRDRHRDPVAGGRLVPPASRRAPRCRRRGLAQVAGRPQPGHRRHRDPDRADLLEEFLHGGVRILLQFLPDGPVRPLSAGRATAAVPVPGFGGARHIRRRADRRSDRPQAHLVDLDRWAFCRSACCCRSSTCSGPTCWR